MAPLTHPAELSEALGIPFSAQQLAAITAPLEPSVIIAGAGSGKTTVMAARVVWLVGTGQVRPEQVLGLTFTRKAAAELSGRVRAALAGAGVVDATGDDDAGEQVIMTYDAFASRLVADHGLRIGVEGDARMLTGASRFRMASKVVSRAPGPWAELARLLLIPRRAAGQARLYAPEEVPLGDKAGDSAGAQAFKKSKNFVRS